MNASRGDLAATGAGTGLDLDGAERPLLRKAGEPTATPPTTCLAVGFYFLICQFGNVISFLKFCPFLHILMYWHKFVPSILLPLYLSCLVVMYSYNLYENLIHECVFCLSVCNVTSVTDVLRLLLSLWGLSLLLDVL